MFAVLMAPITAGFTEQTQKIDPRSSRQARLYQRVTGSDARGTACLKGPGPTPAQEPLRVPTLTRETLTVPTPAISNLVTEPPYVNFSVNSSC